MEREQAARFLWDFLDWCASCPQDTVFCRMGGEHYAPTQYVGEDDNTVLRLINGYLDDQADALQEG